MTDQPRRKRTRRVWIAAVAVVVVLALAFAGTAFAALRYDRARSDRILPGVTIEGVPVGEMTRAEAVAAVSRAVTPMLDRKIVIKVGSRSLIRSVRELGMTADVEAAVDRALALASSSSWVDRVYHRWTGTPYSDAIGVDFKLQTKPIKSLLADAAKDVAVAARDASIAIEGGRVVMTHAKAGRALRIDESGKQIREAIRESKASVRLPTRSIEPEIRDSELGRTIVVNISQNMLYLYDGFKVIRRYGVATAKPGFETPRGMWEVIAKVENPTWHNPAPDGWGKGEPLEIPPGPGNPLGTRALYLDAPGIRIHGTPSDASIGTYASHGCIRMHISESEALYPLVPVGTPVLIVGSPPWGDVVDPGAAG